MKTNVFILILLFSNFLYSQENSKIDSQENSFSNNVLFQMGYKYKYTGTLLMGINFCSYKNGGYHSLTSNDINWGGSLNTSFATNFNKNHMFSLGVKGNYKFLETSFNISNKDFEPTLGVYYYGFRANIGYAFPYNSEIPRSFTVELSSDNEDLWNVIIFVPILILGGFSL